MVEKSLVLVNPCTMILAQISLQYMEMPYESFQQSWRCAFFNLTFKTSLFLHSKDSIVHFKRTRLPADWRVRYQLAWMHSVSITLKTSTISLPASWVTFAHQWVIKSVFLSLAWNLTASLRPKTPFNCVSAEMRIKSLFLYSDTGSLWLQRIDAVVFGISLGNRCV